jgi:hypothetical protein
MDRTADVANARIANRGAQQIMMHVSPLVAQED